MDALLSQLKGQGSPSPSLQPIPNTVKTDKLLDTIHLLSQATLLVAQQLQERKQPAPTYLPTPLPTPKSSPVSSAKKTPSPKPKPSPAPSVTKTPSPKPSPAPMLSWVLRAPEYYRLPPPNPITSTHSSVPTPTKPVLRTPHTKKDRKPKSKRTPPSTQPIPSPTLATTPATPQAVQTALREPLAPPNPTPQVQPDHLELLTLSTSRSAQTDRREPSTQTHPLPTPTPSTQTHPLPTPTSSTPSTDAKAEAKAATKARRKLALMEKRKLTAASSKPTAPTPTPTPPPTLPPSSYEDATPPVAPANSIVNFPHSYDDCPRLPECPAHKVKFAVYSQAYAARTRDAPLPSFPQPHAGPGFELRAKRDTAWWPVPPSNSSFPPGMPADPDAFLFPPPDDDSHLTY